VKLALWIGKDIQNAFRCTVSPARDGSQVNDFLKQQSAIMLFCKHK